MGTDNDWRFNEWHRKCLHACPSYAVDLQSQLHPSQESVVLNKGAKGPSESQLNDRGTAYMKLRPSGSEARALVPQTAWGSLPKGAKEADSPL